jgi:integrase
MISSGLSRKVINARINRVKRMFRWAAGEKLLSSVVACGLTELKPLKFGRRRARETPRVKPVSDEHVLAVLPFLLPQTRTMVRYSAWRACDRKRSVTCGPAIWICPNRCGCMSHGHIRPSTSASADESRSAHARELLRTFLKPDQPEKFMFSPKEAMQNWRAAFRSPTLSKKRAENTTGKAECGPGEQYTRNSYQTAIARACKKARVPRWGPNRLRHACATKIRKKYGIEGAAAVLGNGLGMVTELYAEKNFQLAVMIAGEMG